MAFSTCDLYDQFEAEARVPVTALRDFGGRTAFHGTAVTVKCFEDNSRVKELVSSNGASKVLVIDGGESRRCALLGDLVAKEAADNGWEGLIVFGCVRDTKALSELDIGVKAMGSIPRKSTRRGEGSVDIVINAGGVLVQPGDGVVADEDGILILDAAAYAGLSAA